MWDNSCTGNVFYDISASAFMVRKKFSNGYLSQIISKFDTKLIEKIEEK